MVEKIIEALKECNEEQLKVILQFILGIKGE